MSNFVLTDAKIWLGDYDLSGLSNEIRVEYGAEMLDHTPFGLGGFRRNKAGLKTFQSNGRGFQDHDDSVSDSVDKRLFDRIQATNILYTVGAVGTAEGDRMFFSRVVNADYKPLGGQVGEMSEFEFSVRSSGSQPLIGGYLLGTGAKTATGNTTTPVQIGAVDDDPLQYLWAGLHVFAYDSITDLVVTIESDNDSGFASPTTRATFSTVTAVGSEFLTPVAGPITDDYWRAKWTINGAGSVTIGVVVGIQGK